MSQLFQNPINQVKTFFGSSDNRKLSAIFLSMVLLVVSNAKVFENLGIDAYFEYGIYFLLLCQIWFPPLMGFLRRKDKHIRYIPSAFWWFLAVSFLFSVGIAVQSLGVGTRLRLIATMLVISSFAIMSEGYMDSFEKIRAGAYGVFAGTLVTSLISLCAGVSLWDVAHEGFINMGFTGGVQYKNFYAGIILGSFMGLFLYNRYVKCRRGDVVLMVVEGILLFLSSARGAYILFAVFFCVFVAAFLHKELSSRLSRWQYGLLITATVIVIAVVGYVFFTEFVMQSETYLYRYRGVVNYLRYLGKQEDVWFHTLFGDAGMAWSIPELNYVWTIREHVGADGSYEMGFINVFIKNGLLGLIGFALLFSRIVYRCIRSVDRRYTVACLSLLTVLLVSALVESFISNMHAIFGMHCYLMMAGFCGMIQRENSRRLS